MFTQMPTNDEIVAATSGAGTISSDAQKCAGVWQAAEDMVVDQLVMVANAVTASGLLEVRIETVDGDCLPTGTLWAANTSGSATFSSVGTNVSVALTASATINRGQFFAVVVLRPTGSTFNGQMRRKTALSAFPFYLPAPAASAATTGILEIAMRKTDGSYAYLPRSSPAIPSTSSTSTVNAGNYRGNVFVPARAYEVHGVTLGKGLVSASTTDASVMIIDGSNTVLASKTVGGMPSSSSSEVATIMFDSPIVLAAGATYRIVMSPIGASGSVREGGGSDELVAALTRIGFIKTSSSNGTSWTDTSNAIVSIGLVINAAYSSGGGTTPQRARII